MSRYVERSDAFAPERASRQDRGASMVEYVLLVAFIAVLCITALAFFGNQASNRLSTDQSVITANGG